MPEKNARQKSRNHFNNHRKSHPTYGGYWRHDYQHQLEETGRIPDMMYGEFVMMHPVE